MKANSVERHVGWLATCGAGWLNGRVYPSESAFTVAYRKILTLKVQAHDEQN